MTLSQKFDRICVSAGSCLHQTQKSTRWQHLSRK